MSITNDQIITIIAMMIPIIASAMLAILDILKMGITTRMIMLVTNPMRVKRVKLLIRIILLPPIHMNMADKILQKRPNPAKLTTTPVGKGISYIAK